MSKYQTLSITPKTKTIITKLAKRHELKTIDFVHAAAVYFDKTGVNPKDMVVLSPADELKKFRNTIVSFMRAQEKDFILPTFGKMDLMVGRFMQYLDEEAPRRDDKSKRNRPVEESKITSDTKEILPEKREIENIDYKAKYEDALNNFEREKIKVQNIKSEFAILFNNTKMASTGMSKKLVIQGMNEPSFIELKKLYKKL